MTLEMTLDEVSIDETLGAAIADCFPITTRLPSVAAWIGLRCRETRGWVFGLFRFLLAASNSFWS
jgi:hypothetical protein